MITRQVTVSDKVTPLQAAKVLGVSRSYVYQLIAADALKAERLGPRTILISRDCLISYLRSQGALVELHGNELCITEAKIPLDIVVIRDLCQRWHITEFALFGSVLREDFRADSDVDVLVTFAPDAHITLFSLPKIVDELQEMFGRPVDLLSRRGVEKSRNTLRREEILRNAEVIYHEAA